LLQMPQLVSFRGRPVKHRRRLGDGLRLTFVSPVCGQRCKRLDVTQAEWDQDGRITFYPKDQTPDVRALAASFVLK